MLSQQLVALPPLATGICCEPEFRNTRHFWLPPNIREPQHLREEREWKAKQLCNICPVKSECLAFAEKMQLEYGVWGGRGEAERGFNPATRIKLPDGTLMRDWPDKYAPCGTRKGYEGHFARGEEPCGPCVWWTDEKPTCGTPWGIAEHIRNKEPLCAKCRAARSVEVTARKQRARAKPAIRNNTPSSNNCGGPEGHRWHRLVMEERPCDACCGYICGTDAGYASHLRYGEWTDLACRRAHSRQEQERQVRRRQRLAS